MHAQHRDRHVDVRLRRDRLPVVDQVHAQVEAGSGQQQGRDELARPRRVQDDPATGHGSLAVHHERQTLAVDPHPEAAQRGQDLSDRAGPHLEVAVELNGAPRQARDGRDEAGHGAGEPAVDPRVPGERTRGHGPVVTRGVDVGTERGERPRHQRGVPRTQGPAYDARRVGEARQHQRPVRQRLAARQ